jgi:V/A-type H+-transporting ATPase subunit I
VEFDRVTAPGDAPLSESARRLQHLPAPAEARISAGEPDLDAWERDGRADLIAGEAQLEAYAADAVRRDDVAALIGWAPVGELPALRTRLAEVGAGAAALPVPRGTQPPTAIPPGRLRDSFSPLVRTYATVPYADVDPTLLAGLAYMVMFGAMFGDVGHGALLMLGALLIRAGRPARLSGLRPYWRLVFGAGLASAVFGALYGECFGPTGLVPTVWLAPMDHPVPLLVAGVGLGAVLLAGAYGLGTVNRVREAGWARALYAAVLALTGLGLAFTGLLTSSGGGASGAAQAVIELFDLVVRLGANVVSFARLAAFGLTHAVIGWIVLTAAAGMWRHGGPWLVAAVVVFLVGNAAAFALEALVAGVQALRLEYYELFSRVFEREGRPFRPWHLPVDRAEPAQDPPGDGHPAAVPKGVHP